MGLAGISPSSLLLILLVVLVVFGTKRLRGLGGDLGQAVSGFRKAVKEGDGVAEDVAKLEQDGGLNVSGVAEKRSESA